MRPKSEYNLADGMDFLLYDILQVQIKIAEKMGVELEEKHPELKVVENKEQVQPAKTYICKHCGKKHDNKIDLMACARNDKKEGAKNG